jgi:hypothetical protein
MNKIPLTVASVWIFGDVLSLQAAGAVLISLVRSSCASRRGQLTLAYYGLSDPPHAIGRARTLRCLPLLLLRWPWCCG